MNILVTNDDGINAEGIAVLARAAKHFGNVTVVAPASQCSAMSHRITIGREMHLEECAFPLDGVSAYSLDGTPADCVKAAMDALMPECPDVVLSGINIGYNVGFEIAYSGTVGAAMDALMYGVPAIAVSRNDIGSFDAVEEELLPILEKLINNPPAKNEIWNVNFPGEKAKGILWGRKPAADCYYDARMRLEKTESGLVVKYPPLLDVDNSKPRGAQDSDLYAVISGYISVGRLRFELL